MWPTEQRGYVSPHPWADYITSGAVVEAAGVFEIIRRPLRARGLGAAKLTMLAVGLAVVVAIAFLAIASIVHVLR